MLPTPSATTVARTATPPVAVIVAEVGPGAADAASEKAGDAAAQEEAAQAVNDEANEAASDNKSATLTTGEKEAGGSSRK
jgi:hypothetical protein